MNRTATNIIRPINFFILKCPVCLINIYFFLLVPHQNDHFDLFYFLFILLNQIFVKPIASQSKHTLNYLYFLVLLQLFPIWISAQPGTLEPLIRIDQFGYLPDMEKVAEFARFAKNFDFDLNANTPEQVAPAFNRLTKMSKENELLKSIQNPL